MALGPEEGTMGSIVSCGLELTEKNVPGHWTAEANGFFFGITLGGDGLYTLRIRGGDPGEGEIIEGLTLADLEQGVDIGRWLT